MNDLWAELQKETVRINAAIEHDLEMMAACRDPKLVEILRYGLLGGGKRIRPFLVTMATALCGGKSSDSYPLAIAFEYLHAATLFHDDIIDQSEMRRGKTAVHKKYGAVSAILAGDFLLTHSMEIVGNYTGQAGIEAFNIATKGMVDGEFWQLRNSGSLSLEEQDYREAVMRKTCLLIAAACVIGAIYAGAQAKELAALRCYGENLGFAFQVVDDLLDYLGDSKKTGKALGNDLKEAKMTLPLILAVKHADSIDKRRILAILRDPHFRGSEQAFAEMVLLIEKNSGFTFARQQAENAIEQGNRALHLFSNLNPAGEKAKELLVALGQFVVTREK